MNTRLVEVAKEDEMNTRLVEVAKEDEVQCWPLRDWNVYFFIFSVILHAMDKLNIPQ